MSKSYRYGNDNKESENSNHFSADNHFSSTVLTKFTAEHHEAAWTWQTLCRQKDIICHSYSVKWQWCYVSDIISNEFLLFSFIIKEGKQNALGTWGKIHWVKNTMRSGGSWTKDQNSVRFANAAEVLLQEWDSQPEAGIKDCACNWKRIQEHAGTSGKFWELLHQTLPL